MYDLIYDFIYEVIMANSNAPGVVEISALLTYTTIVLIFFVLVKLVIWAFNVGLGRKKYRN